MVEVPRQVGKHPKLYHRRPGLALGCQNVRKSRVPKVVSQGAEWTVGLGTSMRTGRLSKKGMRTRIEDI